MRVYLSAAPMSMVPWRIRATRAWGRVPSIATEATAWDWGLGQDEASVALGDNGSTYVVAGGNAPVATGQGSWWTTAGQVLTEALKVTPSVIAAVRGQPLQPIQVPQLAPLQPPRSGVYAAPGMVLGGLGSIPTWVWLAGGLGAAWFLLPQARRRRRA